MNARAEWRGVTLGEITRPITDREVPDPITSAPFIGMEHVASNTGRIEDMGRARDIRSSSPIVKRGDVLYGRLRPYLNKVTLAPTDAYASGEFIVFREAPGLDQRFLRWRLAARDFVDFACTLNTGDRPRVKWPQMRAFQLLLPPIEEQRRIVDILEDHLSRLDAAERNVSLSLARVEAMLKATLWHATHGLGEPVPLHEVAEVKLGRQRSPKNHTGEHMVKYLRAANIHWNRLRLDDVKTMNFSAAEVKIFRLRHGDILLSEASGSASEVGKSAIFQGELSETCFQNTVLRVRCHGARPDFVQKYLLAEAYAGRFVRESRGVGIHHLGRSRLARWLIELPDIDEQQPAALRADTAFASADSLRRQLGRVQLRGAALRRAMLASAFSGKLTGRHTDDDVIEELAGA